MGGEPELASELTHHQRTRVKGTASGTGGGIYGADSGVFPAARTKRV